MNKSIVYFTSFLLVSLLVLSFFKTNTFVHPTSVNATGGNDWGDDDDDDDGEEEPIPTPEPTPEEAISEPTPKRVLLCEEIPGPTGASKQLQLKYLKCEVK